MLSAITAEYCPPSAWNGVRDHAEYALTALLKRETLSFKGTKRTERLSGFRLKQLFRAPANSYGDALQDHLFVGKGFAPHMQSVLSGAVNKVRVGFNEFQRTLARIYFHNPQSAAKQASWFIAQPTSDDNFGFVLAQILQVRSLMDGSHSIYFDGVIEYYYPAHLSISPKSTKLATYRTSFNVWPPSSNSLALPGSAMNPAFL